MKLRALPNPKAFRGKRVLVRADFNVPVAKGKIAPEEDWRLRKVAPTVELLVQAGARVILASHLGRPGGKKDAALKLDPIAKRLAAILRRPVKKLADCVGTRVEKAVREMKDGDVVLLENLRFHPGEEKDDPAFAEALAELADAYVNEAFATCHRAAASLVGAARRLPAYAGPLLMKEVEALESALKAPQRPYLVVMGGAKVADKIGVISRLLSVADRLLLGGALVGPFFQARGHGIGLTASSDADLSAAKHALAMPEARNLILPCDVVVGDPAKPEGKPEVVDVPESPADLCGPGRAILDVGPKTVSAYASFIRSARMIVWNGPLGLFEVPKYSHGTLAIGRLIAARSKGRAYGLVGGGETVLALSRTGLMDCVDHVSTGGGAMLEFLEGKDLPGLRPLKLKS